MRTNESLESIEREGIEKYISTLRLVPPLYGDVVPIDNDNMLMTRVRMASH